jgi:maltooligosyltrehalose trehalohydrolase
LRTVCNFDGSRWTVPLDTAPLEVVMAWEPGQTRIQNRGLHLPPQSVAIVRIDADRGMG